MSLPWLTVGPDVGYRIELESSFAIEPCAAIFCVWDFSRARSDATDGEAAPRNLGGQLQLRVPLQYCRDAATRRGFRQANKVQSL